MGDGHLRTDTVPSKGELELVVHGQIGPMVDRVLGFLDQVSHGVEELDLEGDLAARGARDAVPGPVSDVERDAVLFIPRELEPKDARQELGILQALGDPPDAVTGVLIG